MKKLICILLAIVTCLSLGACTTNTNDEINKTANNPRAIVVNNDGETERLTADELRTLYNANQIAFSNKYFGAFVTLVADVVSVHGLTVADGHRMVAYAVLEGNWTVEVSSRDLVADLMPGDTVIVTGNIYSAHWDIQLYIVNGWKTTIQPYNGDAPDSPVLMQKPILESISAGFAHTVGLKQDGTVVAAGQNEYGQCNTRDWGDVVSVSAGGYHTVGLKQDGTVVAVGQNEYGQCNVGKWRGIVSVSTSAFDTYGLKSDGTIVCTGKTYYEQGSDPRDWKNIVRIYAGESQFFAWDLTGKLLIANIRSDDEYLKRLVGKTDICAIDSGGEFVLYSKSDGSVAVTSPWGVDDDPHSWTIEESLREVSDWTNIVTITAGDQHVVGIRADRTVVAVYAGYRGDVSNWSNIVAISAGSFHTVGLRADGTVVATGLNEDGQCNVTEWNNIHIPNG